MRVIIGVDGSQDSFCALEFIGPLVGERAKITLYYSAPPVYAHTVPDASAAEAKLRGILASAVFDRASQHLPSSLRQAAKTIVDTHDPAHGLLLAAEECQAELIVIGALGVGPAKPASLGGVARHVVHNSNIPVLVVRGSAPSPGAPMRVLLAISGAAERQDAADLLARLTWPAGTTAQTITVLETAAQGKIPSWLANQLDDEQLAALGMWRIGAPDEAARRLDEVKNWCADLPPLFEKGAPLVANGHAGDEIVGACRERQANLVVVGARRHGAAIRRLLLGSTSEYVLMHAPCSVLLVREKRKS
jgi:nucleotide-binding universal stress UspA family protein